MTLGNLSRVSGSTYPKCIQNNRSLSDLRYLKGVLVQFKTRFPVSARILRRNPAHKLLWGLACRPGDLLLVRQN